MYNISCCQVHFHFPRCVFDESVLKCIDVASAEIKIVWSVHRFPFQLHIRYVSGEASLCKWKDADMDIQYIWLGLTLGVLRGITNVGTIINWLVPCLLSFLSLRSETTWITHCACAVTHQTPIHKHTYRISDWRLDCILMIKGMINSFFPTLILRWF